MTKRLVIAIVLVIAPAAYAGQFDSFMESGQTTYTSTHPDKKFTPAAAPAAAPAEKPAAKPTKVAANPRAKAVKKPPVQAKKRHR